MASLYAVAGIMHFIKAPWFKAVLPPATPHKLLLILLTGLLEIYLALLLLLPTWKNIAIYGLILMLICYFPIHIYMLRTEWFRKRFPLWALWARLPLQFLLIYWAYSYL